MRIFNTQPVIYNKQVLIKNTKASEKSNVEYSTLPSYTSLVKGSNISFGMMNQGMKILHSEAKNLRCAYSGRQLIPNDVFLTIQEKLIKRPNIQSAINLLKQFEPFMHEVEASVFEVFSDKQYRNKKDFQQILVELKQYSLPRLKDKQLRAFESSKIIIEKLPDDTKNRVNSIIEQCKNQIADDTFCRRYPLEELEKLITLSLDNKYLLELYKTWYKTLPSSLNDFDAFVVKYSRKSHDKIAERLVSTAVATIEHYTPVASILSEKNALKTEISDYLLVSADLNNEKHEMSLNKFIWLYDEIDVPKNLQRYVNDSYKLCKNPKSELSKKPYYAEKVVEKINKIVGGSFRLKIKKAS